MAKIKNLIIVESPAKCKTIGKILGSDFRVVATLGHIRDLPKKTMGVNVDKNYLPSYEIYPEKKSTVKALVENIKNSNQVFLAPDEDREGEAIAWHVVEASKLPIENFKRITFHEITPQAIKNAVKNPRELDFNRVNAQQARRILDRLVGYNLSPLLARKIMKGLSAGRVQSSTLKLIVDREREIQNFKTEEYWTISAFCKKDKIDFTLDLIEKAGKKLKKLDIKNESQALEIIDNIKLEDFFVDSIEKKQRKKSPKAPFITSSLQQVASQVCGFSSKRTMSVAQTLYEGVSLGDESIGLITYMRTDSTSMAKTAVEDIRNFLKDEMGEKYVPSKPKSYTKQAKGAQEAHECIRPTYISRTPESVKQYLTNDQFKLYELIWRRAVASQMNDAVFDQNIVSVRAKDTLWEVIGESLVFDGYLKIYDYDQNTKDVLLPNLEKNENIFVERIEPKQHFTEPPPRYTEATLIKALEKNGIGRPSTYAPTISTIIQRGYVVIDLKKIVPQEIGFTVTEALEKYFPNIVDVNFTADMENKLDEVASGNIEWVKMLDEFFKPFIKRVKEVDSNMEIHKELKSVGEKCPECGADLVVRKSRYGEFIGCSAYPKCKYIQKDENQQEKEKPEVEKIDEKCPKCGKELVVRKGKFGKFIACSGYPKCKYSRQMEQEKTDKKCPECGADLVLKFSKRGKFWGCSSYPKCKHIEKY